ncbi:OmpA family protein [Seohaeicola saemankumensis]|uniref:OmpA family protein n=1 Tax=Seohaeicola saemankumensis TaxID=481181 RepID=A0ABW3T9E4_9RHOB
MYKTLAVIGLLGVSACASTDPLYRNFQGEAGASLDDGSFGNATMNNTLAMTNRQNFVIDMSRRFSQEVSPMVNFAFNSAVLDEGARETLREQARWIRQFPEVRFRVYGHTDLVGSDSYNKSLGMRRAQAVVSYLASQGISRSRLEAVASFGETQPLVVTEGRERRNRRTVTEVSGVVEKRQGELDGKYAQIIYREYVNSAMPVSTLSGVSIVSGPSE